MFSKKDPMESSKGMYKTKSNMFAITKYQPRGNSTPKIKTTPQFDLSLQALSKELEIRNKHKQNNEKS